jgi:hypothetical protein
MLSQAGQIRIRAGAGQDLSVSCGGVTATLTLQCPGDNGRSAPFATAADDLIDELHELIWEAHRDLLAHPKTVP